jgi:DNA-binding CsgD family transcriptional regulator
VRARPCPHSARCRRSPRAEAPRRDPAPDPRGAGRRPRRAPPRPAHAAGRGAQRDEARTRYGTLSDRGREVFLLIAQGYAPSRIGERLSINAKTADTCRRRINEKLGLAERADYVRSALALGLLVPEDDPGR